MYRMMAKPWSFQLYHSHAYYSGLTVLSMTTYVSSFYDNLYVLLLSGPTYTVRKVIDFPVPSQDATKQTLPGGE
jgi:hypothetical protein